MDRLNRAPSPGGAEFDWLPGAIVLEIVACDGDRHAHLEAHLREMVTDLEARARNLATALLQTPGTPQLHAERVVRVFRRLLVRRLWEEAS